MTKNNKLEIGSYKKIPHYAIIGDPTDFYVWINEDGNGQSSEWIKGKANLHHELARLHRKKKQDFIDKLKSTFEKNKK